MSKIIIVDDHLLFREGLKLLIENEGMGQVIAEAENGQVFLDLLKDYSPDLVIMDIEMPVMGGLEAIREALIIKPKLKVLVLTMLTDKVNYSDIVYAGAKGFVLKTSGKSEFEKAINTIINGDSYFSAEMLLQIILASKYSNPNPLNEKKSIEFTEREKEVLSFLCEGLSVAEIADKLFLSSKTIEVHRSTLLKKTNTKNTINLVLFAIKEKLIKI